MSLDTQTREIIEDVLQNNRVVLFMKGHRHQPQCGFSARTVAALDMLLPDYLHINVLDHPEIREGIKAYGNWPTIPQLYVDGQLIGGSDIVLEMMESGELAEALGVERSDTVAPRIEIAPQAADMMRNAVRQREGMAVHLRIDAGWQHTLNLAPATGSEQRVTAGDIEICMDTWTAGRADGLKIAVGESLQGTRFLFENPQAPPAINQMSPRDLRAKLAAGTKIELIDVRGPDERAIASIAGAAAWDEATDRRLGSLPRDTMIVFHCHKGGRSQQAAEYMRRKGFRNLHNLAGGIDAWSTDVDQAVPRY
ncbi:MAG: Grx4 family monothiol glutaredoxin [Gammaproteobacteria bacterium]|nr:Grx4 family monothiol glutaredoxin [Gammaproteobacteria bacterium]